MAISVGNIGATAGSLLKKKAGPGLSGVYSQGQVKPAQGVASIPGLNQYDSSSNNALQTGINQMTNTLSGQDNATKSLSNNLSESQSVREAAQKGAQQQQYQQAGLSQSQQNILGQQQDRALSTERQEGIGQLSEQVLGRADQAASNLASLGMEQQKVDIQKEQYQQSFDEQSKQFNQNLDQNNEQFYDSLNQTDKQFYDSLNQNDKQFYENNKLDWASLDEKISQWDDSFGLESEKYKDAIVQLALENGWTMQEIANNTNLTDAQVLEVKNGINEGKYTSLLSTWDFTSSDTTELEEAYKAWMGDDAELPGFSQYVDAAWDQKESIAGDDLSAYIITNRLQWTGKTQGDVYSSNPAFAKNMDAYVSAQLGVPYKDGIATEYPTIANSAFDEMMKTEDQVTGETAFITFKNSSGYLNLTDSEKLDADELYYDLDYIAKTSGASVIDVPGGGTAIINSTGTVISTTGDFTSIGTLESGARYFKTNDGITYTKFAGEDVQYRKSGDNIEIKIGTGKFKVIGESDKYWSQAQEVYSIPDDGFNDGGSDDGYTNSGEVEDTGTSGGWGNLFSVDDALANSISGWSNNAGIFSKDMNGVPLIRDGNTLSIGDRTVVPGDTFIGTDGKNYVLEIDDNGWPYSTEIPEIVVNKQVGGNGSLPM